MHEQRGCLLGISTCGGQKWRQEASRVGERKGVFIHVVYENYSYDNLDVFVVIDVVIIQFP